MSINFIGGLPEDLTQELLVGKLLVGGLGVCDFFVGCRHNRRSGGAGSSGYGQSSYGNKRSRWGQGHW